MICLKPSQADLDEHSNTSLHNEFRDVQGRLMWSEADSSWCVDSSEGTPTGNLINSEDIIDLLALLSGDPIRLIDQPDTRYTISAYVRYAIEPSAQDVSGWLVDKIDYRGQTKIYATFPAQTSTQWIEAGQAITANVSVTWDDTNMAIRLQIHDYQLGDVPDPKNLLWDEGASQWGYSRNQMVNIPGIAVEDDNGDWWLQRDGTNQSISYHQTTIP